MSAKSLHTYLSGNLLCFFTCFFFSIFPILTKAQGDGIKSVRHFSTSDGLSDNRLTSVIKDREGFLWFGSWAGINRFDGNRFLVFKSNPGDYSSLKSNRIDAIIEDNSSSFLWVRAYDNRVYRFDKRKHTFTSLHELIIDERFKNHQFSKILAVANGRVWLKTVKGHVIVVDDAAGQRPVFNELTILNNDSHILHFFYLDKYGNAWISNESGLSLIRQNKDCTYTIKRYRTKSDNPFKGICEGENGEMWLAHAKNSIITLDTLFRKRIDVELTKGMLHDLEISNSKKQLYCTTSLGELISFDVSGKKTVLVNTDDRTPLYNIYLAKNAGIWVESGSYGVVKFDRYNGRLIGLYPKSKYKFKPWMNSCDFFEDINGQAWLRIKGYNLSIYDAKMEKLVDFKPITDGLNRVFSRAIQNVFYDSNGILWVITDNGGLDRITLQENLFHQNYIDQNSNSNNEVRSVLVDRNDRLWVGTKLGKVLLNDHGKIIPEVLGSDFKPATGIYTIIQDRKGRFWFGTKGDGIFLVEERNGKFLIINRFLHEQADILKSRNVIYSLTEDKSGRIWVATYGGGLVLIVQNGETFQISNTENGFSNYPLDNCGRLRHIDVDDKGIVWIATSEGLVIMDANDKTKGGKFKIYKKEPGNIESLGGNDIQFIYQDSNKEKWVLTSSGGLNKAIGINPLDTLKFKNYSKKQGLSSDFLLACTEDSEKNLWISTRNGISKFSLANQKIQNYSYYDGLYETIFSEASVSKFKDGKIVFGNTLGFLSFQSKELNTKGEKGSLAFTNFQINSEEVVIGDKSPLKLDINYLSNLTLNYNENAIAIEFAMLGSTSTSSQNFVYRLVGFDDVWRNTEGQSKVIYTNLPSGNYTFQVKNQNSELFEGISYRTLKIKILPPFWKTWWAYALYSILIIILLLSAKRIAMTILKLRQGIIVERKLAEVKLNFFTQISHELRTPLTLIINPIEEILQNEQLSNKGKGYAKVIRDNAKRMVRQVNQILDIRKVTSGKAKLKKQKVELLPFVQNIFGYFENYLSNKGLKIEIQSEFKELYILIDSDKIETVIYNILANAIKFSPQKAKIQVNIKPCHGSNMLRIEIIDEGPGVNQTELNKIFQLYYEGSSPNSEVKGTGIGLALAKELIELHDGNIYAENTSDKGLRVVVELPYLIIDNNEVTNEPEIKPQSVSMVDVINEDHTELESGILDNNERKTVLIVEDNMDLQEFLNSKFEDYYQIELASNGEEGLQKAISLLPDLILSDIMMPKMDGIQMLNKLKNNSLTSHIPVILLTARDSIEYHIQSLKYGADYYLPKPLDLRLLFSAVNNILIQRKKFFHNIISEQAQTSLVEEVKENPIVTEMDRKFLEKAVAVVNDNLSNQNFNIDIVAETMGMSRSSFFKKFKSLTYMAPIDFLRDTRLEKSKVMFDEGHVNVSHVAYAVGFGHAKYFGTCFKARFNITPSEYIKSKPFNS